MADMTVMLRINADGKAAVQVINEVDGAERRMGKSGKQAGEAAAGGARQMTQSFKVAGTAALNVRAELDKARDAALDFAKVLIGFHSAKEFAAAIVEANIKLTGWRYGLLAATGSAQKAAAALAFVRSESERLGISLSASATVFTRLAAAAKGTSLAGKGVRDIFSAVAEASRTLHLSAADTQSALIAIDQMMSKGTVQAQELKIQLGQAIPGATHLMAAALGVSTRQLGKMMAAGQVLSTTALPKLAAEIHKVYGAAAQGAAQAPAAAIERFKNAVFELEAAIGDAGFMGALTAGANAATAALKVLGAYTHTLTAVGIVALTTQMTRLVQHMLASRAAKAAAAQQTAALALEELNEAKAAYAVTAAHLAETRMIDELIGSKAALAAADARVIEAEAASAVAAKAAATGIGSWGSKLLALAGGPVGIAIAAIAALAYGIHHLIKAENERHAAALASAKSYTAEAAAAQTLVASINDASEAYVSTDAIMKQFGPLAADRAKQLAQLRDKTDELRRANALYQLQLNSMDPGKWIAAYLFTGKRVADLTDETNQLREATAQANPTLGALAQVLAARVAPAAAAAAAAAAKVKGPVAQLNASVAAFIASLDRSENAAADLKSLGATMAANAQAAAKAVATAHKTHEQIAVMQAAQKVRDAVAAHMQHDKLLNLIAENAADIKLAAAWDKLKRDSDALTAAKQRAARATTALKQAHASASQALSNVQGQIAELTDKLGGSTSAQVTFNAAVRKANADMLALIAGGMSPTAAAAWFAQLTAGLKQVLDLQTQIAAKNGSGKLAADAPKPNNVQQFLARIQGLAKYKAALAGLSRPQQRVQSAVMKATQLWEALSVKQKATAGSLAQVQAAAKAAATSIAASDIINNTLKPGPVDGIANKIDTVDKSVKSLKDTLAGLQIAFSEAFQAGNASQAEALVKQIKDIDDWLNKAHKTEQQLKFERMSAIAGLAANGLRGIQSLTKEGSKAYNDLEVAIDAAAVAQAILAVLSQAAAGPGVGFATMAAMAAAVAPLLAQLGKAIHVVGNSGFTDTAKIRQAQQGTGTVLGDASAQSESIANATKITSDATSKLVDINTGMLRALQSLQAGITGATTMLARGSGDVQFDQKALSVGSASGPISALGGFFSGGVSFLGGIGGLLGDLGQKIWGGSSKITDTGIKIVGGTITELINNIMVGAYETVESKSWVFGSTHTKEGYQPLAGDLGKQFQLILQSLVDTVTQAGVALGIPLDEIQKKIAAFQIAEQHISLKGLSSADKQKAIEAVFSKIFDDLAASVVPFVEQFQKVGEGLGETLVRVATDVQVTQEAIKRLGLSVDETDPEKMAQIAVGLVKVAGGIDNLISGMKSFIDAFASDSTKFSLLTNTLTTALASVGLTLPATRDGMWQLMQSLDASTAAGQAQIAMLLQLTPIADKYYTAVSKAGDAQKASAKAAEDAAAALAKAITTYHDFMEKIYIAAAGGVGDDKYARALNDLSVKRKSTIEQANKLAVAAGKAGISMKDLGAINQDFARQAAALIEQLQHDMYSAASDLFGGTAGDTLDQLNAKIAALQSSAGDAASGIASAAQSIDDTAQLLIGDLSPYKDQKKLQLAEQLYTQGKASAQDVLNIARRLDASGADYNQVFAWVMAHAHTQAIGNQPQYGGRGGTDNSAELKKLIAQRDNLEKQQAFGKAQDLAKYIADYAETTGNSYKDIAQMIRNAGTPDFTLEALAKKLGVTDISSYLNKLQQQNLPGALGTAAQTIVSAIHDLGADILRALGIPINAAAGGAPITVNGGPHPLDGSGGNGRIGGSQVVPIGGGTTYTIPGTDIALHGIPGGVTTIPGGTLGGGLGNPKRGPGGALAVTSPQLDDIRAQQVAMKAALDAIGQILAEKLDDIDTNTRRTAGSSDKTAEHTGDLALAATPTLRGTRAPVLAK